MTDSKLIQDTLSLNEGVPLFDFNVNFTALKKLLVDFNLVLDDHREQLNQLRLLVRSKADKQSVQEHFALLNGAFNLSQQSHQALGLEPQKDDGLRPIDDLCQKSVWVMGAVDKLLGQTAKTDSQVVALQKRLGEKIKSQNKKMDDKFDNLEDTMKKNMQLYFKDANSSFVRLETRIKESENSNAAKLGDALALINRKVNQDALKSQLDSVQNKIQSEVRRMFEAESVKRANFANDIAMKIKDSENAAGQRQVQLQNRLGQLIEKINKSLTVQGFDKEKSKIYEKLGEQKGRIQDLTKKSDDYLEYKRATVIATEKSKQQTMSIQQDIGKLKAKTQDTNSLGNVAALLEKLDPHKICELDAAVKLHADLIAKLQKAQLNNASSVQPQSATKQSSAPTMKSGLSSEQARKFIKDYINQLDLDARIKKIQKDVTEFSKRVDTIGDLEKKLYTFTKEFDFGAIMREMTKKCNAEETRRDIKVTNGKIDQLHDFLKMMRKDLDVVTDFMKKNQFRTSKQPSDNALLTGKKLYPLSCLSCYSGVRTRGNRTLRTPNIEGSLQAGQMNKTLNQEQTSRRSSLNMRRR